MAIKTVIIRHQKTIILKRPTAKTVVKGYAQPAVLTTIPNVKAHVQPLQFKEIRNLPPGQNAIDWRNIWSLTELVNRDQVTYGGVTYNVQNMAYWEEGEFWHGQGVKVSDTL